MDVAKYIGLFLLKNNYCCLQGLGNLELKRKPASQQEGQLNAPHYEAILNNTGSIDDALANFIATNESVSIAKASNEIREFIAYAKAELAAGREVLVPSVGKYVQAHNGAIRFELDPAFSMPAKPVAMPAPVRPAPQPQPAVQESSRQSSINWGLIALWGAILLVVGSILFFGIRYMTQQSSSEVAQGAVADSQMVEVVTPPVVDTMATAAADSLAANTPAVSDTPTYNFVISTYKNLAAAQRREKQLNGYGHQVSISSPDSVSFYVIKPMKVMAADTLHLKDSLSKVLNPSGVTILQ